jgi:ribosome-binding ATPase YchF (GTP1/OBG family)
MADGDEGESEKEEVQEELTALEAIFGDDFVRSSNRSFTIRLGTAAGELDGAAIHVTLPRGYPTTAHAKVLCEFDNEAREDARHTRAARIVEERAALMAVEKTMCCVFDIASAARLWLTEALEQPTAVAAAARKGAVDDDDGQQQREEAEGTASGQRRRKEPKWWDEDCEEDDAKTAQMILEATNAAAAREPSAEAAMARSYATKKKAKKGGAGATTAEWPFVVGLVGKPSSGKSTFFNAACGLLAGLSAADAPRMVPMAAHPFTTIKPNFGTGYCAVPCPCGGGDPSCAAPWGHAGSMRLAQVQLKDVAGLVPGAYRGRGRGNRFLDDLNDADVLVHIVDVSGETDAEGRSVAFVGPDAKAAVAISGGSNPADDVGWIRSELHRWVYDNVKAKWAPVRRKPEKLASLFSGYHASKSLVRAALVRAGVDPGTLAMTTATTADGSLPQLIALADWTPEHLHRVVANFLRTRFPILLALNKADAPTAVEQQNVRRVRETWPMEPAVPVSARGELLLQQLRLRGAVSYSQAAPSFALTTPLPQDKVMAAAFAAGMRSDDDESKPVAGLDVVTNVLENLAANVMRVYGSTGIVSALSRALALRMPSVAFPVADLATKLSLVPFVGASLPQGKLRDCILLRPGATVGDLCEVLKRNPYQLLAGEYVHAEALDRSGTRHTAHKDQAVDDTNSIVCISMTRRAV